MSTAILDIEKKRTLVPQLRFQEFKEEWENKSMRDIAKINQGLQIPISERFYEKAADNYFYITNEFLRKDSSKSYFIKNPSESVICYEDDILMTRTGNTGQVVTGVHGAFHNNFFKIKYDETCSKWFLYFFLTSHKTQHTILKLAGTSTIPDLNHGDFYKITLNIPTLLEQQKIASFLSAVDEKIQQLSRKKELLEQYKKGVMQQLFSGKLRFKDENCEDYPDWEEKKLGDIARITTGSSNRQDSNLDGEYTFFDRSQDIRSSNIFLFDTEAIIVPGEGQEFIPKHFIGKFDLHQRTYAVMDFGVNMGKFLFYYIGYHSNHLNSHAVGSTVKSLRLPMFEKMPIRLPSIPEQQKIANFLSSIDVKIENTGKEIAQMQGFKKGLLQQMFV